MAIVFLLMKISVLIASSILLSIFSTKAQKQDTLSITLESVKYAHPIKYFNINVENQDLKMDYMDVAPTGKANGRVVMLFHGKNFGGYYWTEVIEALTNAGFRVIAPDQIGFGKSSKALINYSFLQLAEWNKRLLDTLGISKTSILGHSMGGMLATRFALRYPVRMEKLLLENPIGLEDYKTFVPYITTEHNIKRN